MSGGEVHRRALRPPSLRPWLIVLGTALGIAGMLFVGTLNAQVPVSHGQTLHPRDAARLDSFLRQVAVPPYNGRLWTAGMIVIESELGDAAVPTLLEAADDDNLLVRRFALECLGMLGDARALPVLVAALDDPVDMVARSAVIGLGDLGLDAGREPLVGALEHESSLVRASAAESLGFLDLDDAQLRALEAHAADPDEKVQRAVKEAFQRQR